MVDNPIALHVSLNLLILHHWRLIRNFESNGLEPMMSLVRILSDWRPTDPTYGYVASNVLWLACAFLILNNIEGGLWVSVWRRESIITNDCNDSRAKGDTSLGSIQKAPRIAYSKSREPLTRHLEFYKFHEGWSSQISARRQAAPYNFFPIVLLTLPLQISSIGNLKLILGMIWTSHSSIHDRRYQYVSV